MIAAGLGKVGSMSLGGGSGAQQSAGAADNKPKEEEKKVEEVEEEEVDFGAGGLFGDDDFWSISNIFFLTNIYSNPFIYHLNLSFSTILMSL